jgi:hypothetical protein
MDQPLNLVSFDPIQKFLNRLPSRDARPAVLRALQESMKFAEMTGRKKQDKKALAKHLAKELINLPQVPDWIEDPAIDLIIDVLAALMFPLDARTMAAQQQGGPRR